MSSSNPLHPHNTSQAPPSSFPFPFLIPPNTDLWLKPPPLDGPPSLPLISKTQPTFYVALSLSSFIRATTTVSFVPEFLYDQAGLVVLFPNDESKSKWIKGGLEYTDGIAMRSVVVATGQDRGADWSVSLPVEGTSESDTTGRVRTDVEFEREEEGTGSSLFVRIGGQVVREITWVFGASQDPDPDPEEEIWVGFYGARPAKPDVAGGFEVLVEEWEIVVKEET
ncbi:hypothetical protein H2248_011263 [Termitomyces sp. 'cryptogamus']|nr:hypothetical protein H2248_011263 [Termitomyces sp. 'cryptogamus']